MKMQKEKERNDGLDDDYVQTDVPAVSDADKDGLEAVQGYVLGFVLSGMFLVHLIREERKMIENTVINNEQEERDMERIEKVFEYDDRCSVRFAYEIDNNDVGYRGIDLVDFEKACLVARAELMERFETEKPEDYEDVMVKFVMTLEFRLFDGLYMGDLADLIDEKDELIN